MSEEGNGETMGDAGTGNGVDDEVLFLADALEAKAAEAARRCRLCGDPLAEPWSVVCDHCARHVPPSLVKAAGDPFDYALRLRTGEVLRFESATLHGDYVRVFGQSRGPALDDHGALHGAPFPCPRGIDVRLSDIVWCADAPEGS